MRRRDLSVEDHAAAGVQLPPFFDYLGMSLVRATPDEAVVRMQVPDVLRSPFGAAHGGVIAALIDTALGIAVACRLSGSDRTATHELNINYIAFVTGPAVTATARVIRLGQSVAHAEAEARAENGTLVAKALATFGVFRNKDG